MPELQALRESAHGAVRLDDLDERAGTFLSAVLNRLLSTVAGEPIREAEGKVWLKAASALTAPADEAERARLLAVAEAPGGTGDFRKSTVLSLSLRVLIRPFPVSSRLATLSGGPPPEPSPAAGPTAPPSTAKKGKKREAPATEIPVSPVARCRKYSSFLICWSSFIFSSPTLCEGRLVSSNRICLCICEGSLLYQKTFVSCHKACGFSYFSSRGSVEFGVG